MSLDAKEMSHATSTMKMENVHVKEQIVYLTSRNTNHIAFTCILVMFKIEFLQIRSNQKKRLANQISHVNFIYYSIVYR